MIALDTETTPFPAWHPKNELLGISVAVTAEVGYYIPIGHRLPDQIGLFETELTVIPLEEVRPRLEQVLQNKLLVAHNWKFDMTVLRRNGFEFTGDSSQFWDTYISAALANEERSPRLGLKHLSKLLLGRQVEDLDTVAANKDLTSAPLEHVVRYAGDDAANTLALQNIHAVRLAETPSVKLLFDRLEMPVVSITRRMEERGILLDPDVIDDIRTRSEQIAQDRLATLQELAGYPFDPNKPDQVRYMLYDVLGLPIARKAGKETADKNQLQVLFSTMNKPAQKRTLPFFQAFLDYKEAWKIRTTYTDSLMEYATADGRIHSAFLQVNAASGRFTSREPNFQNFPRDSVLFDVRSALIADPGYVFAVYDFVQMEFKLASAFSQDPLLVAAANDPSIDVHSATARAVFNIAPEEPVPTHQRQAAKTITFAILYGVTPFGLSKQILCTEDAAKNLIKKFYQQYRGLEQWVKETRYRIKGQGYAETKYGRRRYADMEKLNSPIYDVQDGEFRKLCNTVIQGTGADMTKIAMKMVDRRFLKEDLDAQIVGQIHDELVVLCKEEHADKVSTILEEEMVQEILGVRLGVDGKMQKSLSKAG